MIQPEEDFIRSRVPDNNDIRSGALRISRPYFGQLCKAACPTPNAVLRITAFPDLNSLPRVDLPSFVYRYYSKQSILSRTYCYTEQGISSKARITTFALNSMSSNWNKISSTRAFLKNFAIFIYRKTAVLEFLFNKVAAADSNTGVFL